MEKWRRESYIISEKGYIIHTLWNVVSFEEVGVVDSEAG
jgi:hypothetical protein